MTEATQDETVEIKVPCQVYSRIVGYLTPVENWNKGKAQEFNERVVYDIAPVLEAVDDRSAA